MSSIFFSFFLFFSSRQTQTTRYKQTTKQTSKHKRLVGLQLRRLLPKPVGGRLRMIGEWGCNKGEAQVYWEDMNRDKEREKKRKEGRRGKGKREGRKGTKEKREEIGKRGTRRKRERERVILVTFSPPKKKNWCPWQQITGKAELQI